MLDAKMGTILAPIRMPLWRVCCRALKRKLDYARLRAGGKRERRAPAGGKAGDSNKKGKMKGLHDILGIDAKGQANASSEQPVDY